MKTVKQEESIGRSRFIDCPQCKSRGLKLKRIVQVGRCRNCRESYKIIITFVKTGGKRQKEALHTHVVEAKETPESSTFSWQVPSDNSVFGSESVTGPSFGEEEFGWKKSGDEGQPHAGTGE